MHHHTRNRLLTRVTAPAGEPITLAEAKLYLRVDGSSEDTLITDLIVTARMIAEEWLRSSLMTQSWKIAYDGSWPFWAEVPQPRHNWVHNIIRLAMGPVNDVSSVVAVARDGTTQTIDSSLYFLNAAKNELIINWVVTTFRMEITYDTGYGDATSVPKPIKQGMLAHIAALYDNRGDAGNMALPEQSVQLYLPYREVLL